MKARVEVEVEVNPTEDLGKVKRAVENIFGDVVSKQEQLAKGILLKGQAEDLESLTKFSNILSRERIRAAARKILFQGLEGKTITFYLNKQVAYAGHVSFCQPVAESPLGPIRVRIVCDDPIELIGWLAPRTS